jgi:WD40 repeat protein
MNVAFDPYHKWLGIPPEEQPPNDYRLLGLRLFESDPDVIGNAADRQTLLLRTLQVGKQQGPSQRLLNEVAAARVRLLNQKKKSAYDEELRRQMELSAAAAAPPVIVPPYASPYPPEAPESSHGAPPVTQPLYFQEATGHRSRLIAAGKKGGIPVFAVVLFLCITAGATIYVYLGGRSEDLALPDDSALAQAAPVETPDVESAPATAPNENASSPQREQSTSDSASSPSSNASSSDSSLQGSSLVTESAPVVEEVSPPSGDLASAKLQNDPLEALSDPSVGDSSSSPASVPEGSDPPVSGVGEASASSAESTAESSDTSEEAPATVEALEPRKKKTPPNDEELTRALRQVREIFADQFNQAETPADHVALAKALVQQAASVQDDAQGRYALLLEAVEQSITAGDYYVAKPIIDELDEEWEVDRLRLLGRALVAATRRSDAPSMRADLIETALALMDEAIGSQRYDGAANIANLADDMASRLRDADLRKQTRAAVTRTKRLLRDWQKVLAAQDTLQEDAADPDANLLVGKHLCLEGGDFETGLKHLAKGSDLALQTLAQRDLDEQDGSRDERPEEQRAAAQIALADAWHELANSNDELAGFFLRAIHWYEQAAPQAPSLVKAKAERRRQELLQHEEVKRLLGELGPNRDSLAGYAGPVEITISPLTTLLGHTDRVLHVAFSAHNKIATGSNDNTAKVWDLKKRKLDFTLVGHRHNVNAVSFSFDGKVLATASEDKTVQLWDVAKGRLLRAIPAHATSQGVRDVAFAPNGKFFVTCGAADLVVRVWDAKTFALAGQVQSTGRYVYDVDVTPTGQVVTAGDGAVLWTAAGEVESNLTASPGSIGFAVVSPKGEWVVTGGRSEFPTVWRLEDGQPVAGSQVFRGSAMRAQIWPFANCAAWSPDGRVLALGETAGRVVLIDTSDWSIRQTASAAPTTLTSLAFSADGKVLALSAGDPIVRLLDVKVTRRDPNAPTVAQPNVGGPVAPFSPPEKL